MENFYALVFVRKLTFFYRYKVHQYAESEWTEEMDFRRVLQFKRNAIPFQGQGHTTGVRYVFWNM